MDGLKVLHATCYEVPYPLSAENTHLQFATCKIFAHHYKVLSSGLGARVAMQTNEISSILPKSKTRMKDVSLACSYISLHAIT